MIKYIVAAVIFFAFMQTSSAAPLDDRGQVEDRARLGSLMGNLSVSYDVGHKATSNYLLKEIAKITNK